MGMLVHENHIRHQVSFITSWDCEFSKILLEKYSKYVSLSDENLVFVNNSNFKIYLEKGEQCVYTFGTKEYCGNYLVTYRNIPILKIRSIVLSWTTCYEIIYDNMTNLLVCDILLELKFPVELINEILSFLKN